MANVVNRTSSNAAARLLGLEDDTARAPRAPLLVSGGAPRRRSPGTPAAVASAEDEFRSPYRLEGDELVLLDQRSLPGSLDEVVAKRGSDVAYYLRIGVLRGGPVMAQAAAYGLALTAQERADRPAEARAAELRRTRMALARARPSSRLPAWAMERMEATASAPDLAVDGPGLARALRDEADAIAADFQDQHAAIVSHLVEFLPEPEDRPLGILLHGDTGTLFGGMVGSGLTAVRRLVDDGRDLAIFVTEARPWLDGSRLASRELRQANIPHRIISDSAAAWLFANEAIDAVLIGAEWIARDGDVAGVVGSRSLAQLAHASRATDGPAPARVVVCGVSATASAPTPSGADIPTELRPARDLVAHLADVSIRAADALVPATDVVPASSIDALVTEGGVIGPLTAASLERHLATGVGEVS